MAYDALNREVERHYASGHAVYRDYAADGQVQDVQDYRGHTRYDYDSRGRLQRTTQPNGDYIQNGYDSQGNRVSLTTGFGTTRYGYDALNRMDSVVSPQGQVTEYFYDAVGNRDSVALPNGVGTKYGYDSLNRLKTLVHRNGAGAVLASYAYSVNKAGIRTQVVEADGAVTHYGYDSLYRLISEQRAGSHAYAISYTYDQVGNRLAQVKNGTTISYTYNNRDQLVREDSASSSRTYRFDAAGRLISKSDATGTTTYSWIDDDRMASVAGPGVSIAYAYDADGSRVKETSDGASKQYLIDAMLPYGQVIAETEGGGILTVEYVYGQERVSQNMGGAVSWYLADGQGSVRQLADAGGAVTDSYAYTAFGEALASTGATANDFRYVGEQWDLNAGFYYLRARWMNTGNGRFTSVDPFPGKVGIPASQHPYYYSKSSPMNFEDPTGKWFEGEFAVDEAIDAAVKSAEQTISKSLSNWILTRRVIGISISIATLVDIGWDLKRQAEWLSEALREPPVRMQHYTNEKGKIGIELSGIIDPRYTKEGLNFFSPDLYSTSFDATEYLALPNEAEYYIQLNMFHKADNLSPVRPAKPRYGHEGGGDEVFTDKEIFINGIMRMRSPWIPLTK